MKYYVPKMVIRAASGIADWAEGWTELGRADITEARIREAHEWFVRQAFGKLGL